MYKIMGIHKGGCNVTVKEKKIPVNTGRLLSERLIKELKIEADRMEAQPFKVDISPQEVQKPKPMNSQPVQQPKPMNLKPLPMNPVIPKEPQFKPCFESAILSKEATLRKQ